MVAHKTLDRAYNLELLSYLSLIVAGSLIYALSGYLKLLLVALKLPGPPAVPFIGNILMVGDKNVMVNDAAKAFSLYGTLIRLWGCIVPAFVVLDPHDLQIILSSRKHTDKGFFYKLMHNFLGNGLITSSGDKWSVHRKLIQPSFHLNILEKFIGTFNDSSQCLLDKFKAAEGEINITDFVNNCVLDILNGELTFLNPECQKKCIEEIDTIFDGDTRAPTMKDLREMRYLEQCIKETLRLYPSVPLLARRL
uniref:Uncharacterized protein n=1 Tax=Phlebotomus papatasi TaxID=29031 RepID=A0A1B0D914_PHLPP